MFNDPFTMLESRNLSLDYTGIGTSTGWIDSGWDLLQVRGRALLPQESVEVGSNGREAGGVLITGLNSSGPQNFNPTIFNPIAGEDYTGSGSEVRQQAGETTFPANVVGPVKRFLDATGQWRDQVVVVPARHLTETGADQVEIFNTVDLQVLYRPVGGDRVAPYIARSIGRYDGESIVHFDVTIEDTDVKRVLVLFRADDASGPWLSVDLVKVPGQSRWLGGRPANETDTGPFEYIVQAVDSDANVATATGKGVNFETITPNLNQGVSITVSDAGDPGDGLVPGPVGH